MFDPATSALVRAARALPGLDPGTLVEQLTAAYVDVATTRLALSADGAAPDLAALRSRMSRLADTYESYTALDLFPEQARSAAFVAGAARQVTASIDAIRSAKDAGPSRLDEDAIGGDVAASLLFLVAEQPSDAREAARAIVAAGGEMAPIRRAVLIAVRSLCQGAFRRVTELDPEREGLGEDDLVSGAANLLFREILRGIRQLAAAGLGEAGDEAVAEARSRFELVRKLAVDASEEGSRDAQLPRAVSIYAGPHHLAALLLRAAGTLSAAALVRTPVPGGADGTTWRDWLRAEAGQWPFLWPNHRACIATGYLDRGHSLVMTTPTGSGKTTLATLKIASTLSGGRTVLYLAPTHALVGQVEHDLNARVAGIASARSIEEVSLDDAVDVLPDLAVATPERCLALLTFAPHLFANVGLLAFDEFHLLGIARTDESPAKQRIGRRGIDAMLCLLSFLAARPDADVLLLSAMVSNGAEVAGWLAKLLGRNVHVFDDPWKPTRQLRACVAYDEAELSRLRVALMRGLTPPPVVEAVPWGLFSLVSGWNPHARDKLALRRLRDAALQLGVNRNRRNVWLTSNRGVVAATLAGAFAAGGLKVIVFCENIRMCVSLAKRLNGPAGSTGTFALSDAQSARRDSLIEELGNASAVYDVGGGLAAVHHGELLRGERDLVEQLFRASGSGVGVLAATSTLAQGLNLPCEVVILAGTDRLGDDDEPRTRLPDHEILNALGRAGRAGHASTGLAIVIPATPLGCDMTSKALTSHEDVQTVFSASDQCLPLKDPLAALFDRIETQGAAGEEAEYLLRRLAASLGKERPGVETFGSLAGRTFGYWQLSERDPEAALGWLARRKATLERSLAELAPSPQLPWQEELAARTGASASFIASLVAGLSGAPKDSVDALRWVGWLLDQLQADRDFDLFLRPEPMGRVFGRAYQALLVAPGGRDVLRKGLRTALEEWLDAKPLLAIEATLCDFVRSNEGEVSRPTPPDRHASRARRFALRLVPDIAYLCGVMAQVVAGPGDQDSPLPVPMAGFLQNLVRYGCRTPYHYLIRRSLEHPSRPAVQARFVALEADLDQNAADGWAEVSSKFERATELAIFDDLPGT